MLVNYIKKFGIILPTAVVYLDQEEHTFGKAIDGHLEIKGRFFKNVLKRYEIDLVRYEQDNDTEELLTSSSVYCSRECLPNKKDILPFVLNVPENIKEYPDRYTYKIVVRFVWEDSQILLKKHPLVFQV
ncbi:hypothetical protein NEOCIP111885_04135 [Pseudoneobacillus rhizosphaerae]|jgi:hypothetical protein|uniref:Sporulation protein n=2 Tax=Pseudoneobacillus rhizosphaerae TaxID=2880968 RepID=A0A9C7GDE9_9BACI|nr:hypothetical protein NEOCIP111885_04135 [Pseudoneobacillus rhizosphaerae]